MRIALFTSNHLRHKYVAFQVASTLELKLIISEEKSSTIEEKAMYSKEEQQLLANHFKKRNTSENAFFGSYSQFPKGVVHHSVSSGSINSQNTLDLLAAHDIDAILLFGTSIIKAPILDLYPNRIFNLHLGLSPYYKGSGTNFFPIVNNEFECLGATIHLANTKVDAGAILHQIRPDNLEIDDTIHSLGNKIIEKAGYRYPRVIKLYLDDQIEAHTQKANVDEKIYRVRDFTPQVLEKAQSVLETGGISAYLKCKNRLMAKKPIISNM